MKIYFYIYAQLSFHVNKLRHILILLACTAVLASCTKDDVEGPQTTVAPKAIMSGNVNAINDTIRVNKVIDVSEARIENSSVISGDINDDGDDEDENINPE